MLLFKSILLGAGIALALLARYRKNRALAAFSPLPWLLAAGIEVVPQGVAALRISVFGGVSVNTLYPGVYWVWPCFEHLDRFETRDRVLGMRQAVNTKEGRRTNLGVVLRYRVEPEKLAYLQGVRPASFEEKYIGPVVASEFVALAPSYEAHELFCDKREEYREAVACSIAKRLEADGILTSGLLVSDVELPTLESDDDCDPVSPTGH